jgi:hypothetical protein
MRFAVIGAALLLAAEAAALACSCLATDDPAELQRLAAESGRDAVALVEVEALTSYDSTGEGERMRVIRVLAGTAPALFRIERRRPPSSASCDIEYSAGERSVVILYPAASAESGATYRTSGLCTDHLLDKPVFLDAVAREIGAVERAGERG